jgi:simple sugar transport system ATP-binding protein
MAAVTTETATPILKLEGIRKEFGGVVALQGVDLDLHAGEVIALVGDNGAGKSTLLKTVVGVHGQTDGRILLGGEEVTFSDATDARKAGIEVVYQDLALADHQSVYMNMFLGRELKKAPLGMLDKRRMMRETQELLDELDIRVPSPRALVRDLSGGQRQGVAIGRATHWAERLILMDEPTAALGVQETSRVEELIHRLKDRGRAMIVVSHNLAQVFRISDRICVLRRGEQVGVRRTSETSENEIVSMITGLSR